VALRPPAITFDRVKVSVFIIGYALLAEWVDPRPFANSSWAKILYLLLALEIVRQFWTYFLETSLPHVERSRRARIRWDRIRFRFSADARYRFRRVVTIAAALYLFGYMVDGATTRCDAPAQCTLLFPKILVENVPIMFKIALGIAMGMFQMLIMFIALTKVGAFRVVSPGTIPITFDDVYGQDKALARVKEQVDLLEDSEAVEAAGGFMPKGILLWGPPGTGKTMMAKAAANASTKPLILVPPGGFASTFIGINFLKVWMLFRTIRKLALRHGGVLCFIDEIDALGNRGGMVADQAQPTAVEGCIQQMGGADEININAGGMNMGTLEAFLSAMDGMDQPRGFINKVLNLLGLKPLPPPKYKYLMIGATNIPSKLDQALTRAGRFGRKIHVPYPDYQGRVDTFNGYFGKVSHQLTDEEIERLARDMHRGTGAEIEDAVNEALLVAFSDERDSITVRDVHNAILWKQFGESDGQQELDEDKRRVAIHEAGHAVAIIALLPEYQRIRFGMIEKRGGALGMIAHAEIADRPIRPRSVMLARVAVSLASAEAERAVFGESTNGMGGDQRNATGLARQMVQRYGMGSRVQVYGDSEFAKGGFDEEVEAVLEEGRQLAEETVTAHLEAVEAIAALLIDEGLSAGTDIENAYQEAVA
jgi:ATP-dependent Zn protease